MTNPASPEQPQQPYGEPQPYDGPPSYQAPQPYGTQLYGTQQYGAQPYGTQQYGTQQAYALPASGYGRTTNVLAIISMTASIIGLVSFAILSIAGVIMGHIALSQIKRRGEAGRGMAIAGLIVGYAGIAFWILMVVLWIAFLGIFVTAAGASSTLS